MIGIIDYGMSNLHSVKNACDYLNLDSVVSKDVSSLSKCDKLILPGVGAFQDCMNTLHSMGLYDFVVQQVKKDVPLLGICLGMQALFESSEENGYCLGFGFIKGHVCHMEDIVAGRSARDSTGGVGEFGQADGGDERGILQDSNGVVAECGQHAAEGLRQDDRTHGLHVGHAERAGSFHLSLVERLNAGAEDFTHISARIQGDGADAGEHCAVVRADVAGKLARNQQAVNRVNKDRQHGKVHEKNLHKERRAAKEAHVDRDRPAHAVVQEAFKRVVARLCEAAHA